MELLNYTYFVAVADILFFAASSQARSQVFPQLDSLTVTANDTSRVVMLSTETDKEDKEPLKNIFPVSPQAASLARYGEYPVSYATGVPDITIPIYTIKIGEYTLPVSVSYHASGIKVDDVASTVGLGWSLNAGGVITRQICGAPDRQHPNMDNSFFDYAKSKACAENYGKNGSEASAKTLNSVMFGNDGRSMYDSMSDRYTFNFAGKSGMFLYSYTDDQYVPLSYSKMLIEPDGFGSEMTFRIVDTDGIEYIFAQQERSGIKSEEHIAETSAWYLTDINTPWGNIHVSYMMSAEYETNVYDEALYVGYFGHYVNGGSGTDDYSEFYNDTFYNGYRSKCLFNTPVVSAITWNGNRIEFSYRDDREDIWKTRLGNITVKNREEETVRTVTLYNSSYWGNTSDNKRMMLCGLDCSDTGTFRMEYDTTHGYFPDYGIGLVGGSIQFGEKKCSKDFWGYYNGRNDYTSIPQEALAYALDRYPVGRQEATYYYTPDRMADRHANSKFAALGMLKSITYPTGGKTVFEFEGNDIGYGGLRIKALRNTDTEGNVLEEKRYSYHGAFNFTDEPEKLSAYEEYHVSDIYPDYGFLPSLYEHVKCCGEPCFPIGTSTVFYSNVTETHLNGESTDYEYDTYPGKWDLCGYYQLGEVPFSKYPHTNDFGNTVPYLTAKTSYNSGGNAVKRETFRYGTPEIKTFSSGCRITSLLKNATTTSRQLSPRLNVYYIVEDKDTIYITNGNVVAVDSVAAHAFVSRLEKKETTDFITGVTTNETYEYDPKFNTNSPRSVTTVNSDGKMHTTEYTYAFDLDDDFHRRMVKDFYIYDTPVETRNFCNGKLLSRQTTEFSECHDWIFPKRVVRAVSGGTPYEKYRFAGYDSHGNLTKLVTNTCDTDSIEWGYGGMYPTRHLHNGSLMAAYSWKPLCGVSSIEKPNGYATDYGYDSAGRLSSVSDALGTWQRFVYNYCNGTQSETDNDYICNYVKTANLLSADETYSNVTLQYADGLGRPFDKATDGVNEHGKFIHSFSSYDSKGRTTQTWLPVVANDGDKPLNGKDVAEFSRLTYSDDAAYSDMTYDALDRIVYSSTPGIPWHGKGKSVEYMGNGKDDIRLFLAPLDRVSLVDDGFYDANTLHGERTTDEDGHSVTVFTDKLGRKVLERRNDGSSNNDTYFVYNDLGQLRYVLSPEYQNAGYKDKYAYEYRYDERGNVVKKILPGCEYMQYWYDRGDRLSFMQDATLREMASYRFYLYDSLGRTVVQGLCSGCNRSEEVNIAEYQENVDGICNTGYNIPLSDKITNPNLETVNYYDGYSFLQKYSAELGNLASDFQVGVSCAQGLQTGKVQITSDGGKVIDAFFYDGKGQVVDSRRLHLGKRLTCIHTDYSYTGKPTRIVTDEYSVDAGNKSLVVSQIQENTYSKKTDRLLSSTLSVNGKKETIQQLEYDELGRIKSVARGGNAGAVVYGYNLHGWTTDISSKDFTEKLHYSDGVGTPCFNGNISSQLWSASDYGQTRGYKFDYDGLDRLKDALYGERESLSDKQNRYNEKVIEYTANGAIKRFQRRGLKDDGEYGKIDNLNIKLNGNQLLSVTDDALPANKYSSFSFIDGANEEKEYEYNGVGALTKDLNRGLKIKYDNLNYPKRITTRSGNCIEYSYLPDGTKLSQAYGVPLKTLLAPLAEEHDLSADVSSEQIDSLAYMNRQEMSKMSLMGYTEYSGNMIYEDGKLTKVLFPGGYSTFEKGINNPTFHYFTQDHLGNNRIVLNEDGTVEQIMHYYPFGGTFNDAGLNPEFQQYKYNGKELNRTLGLDTYDYGARQYFSALPMWDRMDPLCEKDYHVSPYVYCRNNPIKLIDDDGNKVKIIDPNQRQELLNYTSTYFQKGLSVDDDGFLFVSDNRIVNKAGSKIFTENFIKAINNKELTINLSIESELKVDGKTYSVSEKGDGATYFISPKEIGSAITGRNHIVYDKNNQPIEQTPSDILMHELFGHAIPKIINADYSTGNAIKNENIIRRELNLKERIENDDKE